MKNKPEILKKDFEALLADAIEAITNSPIGLINCFDDLVEMSWMTLTEQILETMN